MTPDDVDLSREIARLREKAGMTQVQLAGAVGASERTVIRWENGRAIPSQPFAIQLEAIIGVPAGLIAGLRENQGQPGTTALFTDLVETLAEITGDTPAGRDLMIKIMEFVQAMLKQYVRQGHARTPGE